MESDIQRLLFELRERPQDFAISLSGCRLVHTPSKHEIWIANGLPFYRLMEPYAIGFTFADKIRLCVAYRRWRKLARTSQRHWLRNWLCEPQAERIKVEV